MDILNISKKQEKTPNKPLSSEEKEKQMESLLLKMKLEGKSIKEALEIDSSYLEYIYEVASQHYNAGHYKKAYELFNLIAVTDPTNYNYGFALGSTCHQLKQYADAIMIFAILLNHDEATPEVAYYLGDSFYHANLLPEAKSSFEITLEWCGEEKKYNLMKKQAALLIECLNKKIFENK